MWNFGMTILYFLGVFLTAAAAVLGAENYAKSAIMVTVISAGVVIYAIFIAWKSISKKLDKLLEEKEKETDKKD